MTFDPPPDTGERRVLDIGCGTRPHRGSTHIMDLELDTFYDKKCILHNAEKPPYPFPDNYFDYIYCHMLMEHLTVDDSVILNEMFRILKVCGKVEITVPNSLFIYHRLLYLVGIIPCDFILCHRKHYSFQQLKHNLRNSGFKVYELLNRQLLNPFKNYTCPHIKMIGKKVDSVR